MFKELFTESKIYVDTSNFEAAHGRSPRGKGGWAFSYDKGARGDDVIFISGSYTDAKKQMLKKAKQDNQTTVYVLG